MDGYLITCDELILSRRQLGSQLITLKAGLGTRLGSVVAPLPQGPGRPLGCIV